MAKPANSHEFPSGQGRICLECQVAPLPANCRSTRRFCDGCKTLRIIRHARQWARQNLERRREVNRNFAKRERKANPDRVKARVAAWRRSKPHIAISDSMGTMVRIALAGGKGRRSWETIVGYTVEQLAAHLERQFVRGMSWENYGKWQIDHIRPVSSFSFRSPEDEGFKDCWSLTNLRPLWAADNIKKHAKRTFLI